MANRVADISKYLDRIERASSGSGPRPGKRSHRAGGKSGVPDAWIGEICLIRNPRSSTPLKAEVVGFRDGDVLLDAVGRTGQHRPA